MKIYISADMEGVTGVTHSQEVIPGRSQSERFRGLLTADVNAAIEGAAQAGATEFLVNEAHDGMRNILLEDLDPRAEVIVGQRKPYSMMQGFEGAGLVFFVGYHARAGTEGVLSHTFDSPTVVTGVWLNGEPCSEARMNATLIGLKGIPVGLVTDDDLARAEAESLYAGVQTARVKTAVDRYTARCLSPQAARERIREAALRAAGKGDLTPYAPEPPYSFTIEFATASSATSVLFFPAWSAWTTGASHGSTRTTKRPSRCSSASCGCPAATLTTVRRNRELRLLHRGRLRRREIRGQPARRRSWRLRLAR